jgi:hypothetical protein
MHQQIAKEIADLLDKKRKDYGTENIKKFGTKGVLVRVSDKVERLINLGIETYVNDKALVIEVPIDILTMSIKYYPDNYPESSVKHEKQRDFAELIAEHLHDEVDQESGANFIHNMFDAIFTEILEGNIDDNGTIDFEEE